MKALDVALLERQLGQIVHRLHRGEGEGADLEAQRDQLLALLDSMA